MAPGPEKKAAGSEVNQPTNLGRKAVTNLDGILESRHCSANKGLSSQSYGFSSSHVWIESWNIKKLSAKELML